MDNLLNIFLKGKSWKAYCISLPRCVERREKFTSFAKEIGLTFTFWDAFDKNNLKKEDCNILIGTKISKGATACRRSHEQLWTHILQNDKNEFFFIFEDDAGFRKKTMKDIQIFLDGVSKVKKQWSAIQFGFGTMTGSELHLLSKQVPRNIFQADFIDQTHAILYTRKSIQEILVLSKDSKFNTRPSDGLLLSLIQKKNGIILSPETSIIEQVDTISYISQNE